MANNIHKSYLLSTTWTRLEPADTSRKGIIFQNQTANSTMNIFVAQDQPTGDFAALQLVPAAELYEDILPPNGAIWAKCDGAGTATLTLVLKY